MVADETALNPHVRSGASVLGLLDPVGVTTIIDAGCGTGRVTELLLERMPAAQVYGVDGSWHMLQGAADRLAEYVDAGRLHLLHADLTKPLPLAPVDAILSTATFHWIHDHDALFANLAAALRPGGQLVAQCGGADIMGGESWAGPTYFATPEETSGRLLRLGFVDVDTWLQPMPDTDYVRLNIVARRAG